MSLTQNYGFWSYLSFKKYYNKLPDQLDFINNSTLTQLNEVNFKSYLITDDKNHSGIIEYIGSLCGSQIQDVKKNYDLPDFKKLLLLDFENWLINKNDFTIEENDYFYFSKIILYSHPEYFFKLLQDIIDSAKLFMIKNLSRLGFEDKQLNIYKNALNKETSSGFLPTDIISYLIDKNPIEVMNGKVLLFDPYILKTNSSFESFLFSLLHELLHINEFTLAIFEKEALVKEDYCYLAVEEEFRVMVLTETFKKRWIKTFWNPTASESNVLELWKSFYHNQKQRFVKMKAFLKDDSVKLQTLNEIIICLEEKNTKY